MLGRFWKIWVSVALIVYAVVIIDDTQGAGEGDQDDRNCTVVWKDGGVLENEETRHSVHKRCMESSKLNYSQFKDFSFNVTMDELDFDDNCYSHCNNKELGLLHSDGSIDKTKTESFFKGNLTTEVLNQVMSMWNECIDEAEKVATRRGLNKCRMSFLHDFCFIKKAFVDTSLGSARCTSE